MNVHVIGCTHVEAGVEIRQQLSFNAQQMTDFLTSFKSNFPELELVCVSTCNRVELYTACEAEDSIDSNQIAAFWSEYKKVDLNLILQTCFQYDNRQALQHLFNVASSLESMALGDVQIISQVRRAHEFSMENHCSGPILNQAFQTAVKIARRIDTETEIHRHRTSIASIAVQDFAKNIFETFSDKKILVIGAGEIAEETLAYLIEEGVGNISIINRTLEKAQQLAERKGGIAVPWSELESELKSADLTVSAAGGSEAIVQREQFKVIHQKRSRRPLFILDLGVPRNFDPQIGNFPEVYLYSIDDLEKTCQRNRATRQKQLPKAYAIVEQETEKFIQDFTHRQSTPILTKLHDNWESIMESELKRLFNKRPHLTEEDQQAIEQSFERLLNKLLHSPYEAIRNASSDGIPRSLLDSIVKLFRLKQ